MVADSDASEGVGHPMLVSCVSRTEQIVQGSTGVVVFPERVAQDELEAAQAANPASVIVGAVVEDRRCRGYVFHRGKNQITVTI